MCLLGGAAALSATGWQCLSAEECDGRRHPPGLCLGFRSYHSGYGNLWLCGRIPGIEKAAGAGCPGAVSLTVRHFRDEKNPSSREEGQAKCKQLKTARVGNGMRET